MKNRIWLTPNVRLRLTVESEMYLKGAASIFTEERYRSYISMHEEALKRQNDLIKSVIVLDLFLVLFLNGGSINIPGFDVKFSEIPATRDVLSILCAFSFMMLCWAFTNTQLYEAITQVIARVRYSDSHVDPDFITASDTYTELGLKVMRSQMAIGNVDFFTPGRAFKLYYGTLLLLFSITILLLLASQIALTLYSGWPGPDWTIIDLFVFGIVVIANSVGLMLAIGLALPFDIPDQSKEEIGELDSQIPDE